MSITTSRPVACVQFSTVPINQNLYRSTQLNDTTQLSLSQCICKHTTLFQIIAFKHV